MQTESALEEAFRRHINKYLNEDVRLIQEHEVKTICGDFRLDFMAEADGRKIGFECDGKEFHSPLRDEWRDGVILGGGFVDVIYRLKGADLTYHMDDILYFLSRLEPAVFSERGKGNLETLSSDDVKRAAEYLDGPRFRWGFSKNSGLPMDYRIIIERHDFALSGAGVKPFCLRWYEYALAKGGGDIDALMEKWNLEMAAKMERRQG